MKEWEVSDTSARKKIKVAESYTSTMTKTKKPGRMSMAGGVHAMWPKPRRVKPVSVTVRKPSKFAKKVIAALEVVKGYDVAIDCDTGASLSGAGRQAALPFEIFGMKDILQMNNRNTVVGATEDFSPIQFKGMTGKLSLVNPTTVPVHVTEYVVVPRIPHSIGIIAAWNNQLTSQAPLTGSTNTPVDYTTIGSRPNDSNLFCQHWKIVGFQEFVMGAGECRNRSSYVKGKIFTPAVLKRVISVSNDGTVLSSTSQFEFIPGITQCRLFVFRAAYGLVPAAGGDQAARVTCGPAEIGINHTKRATIQIKDQPVVSDPYRLVGVFDNHSTATANYILGTAGNIVKDAAANAYASATVN